ncbi:hypothetical protein Micbo1qcDRAFT_216006 [Microdochium bolleyi]|uniref:Uncharacterized protein n=1 Tax=Microdochium bolleyi TaxID=196109 RepID=A0A136IRL3_9PEZI|nr:hypothetical protein Micbo1qcDRAFT_216006 [Microdochium bolleyi]
MPPATPASQLKRCAVLIASTLGLFAPMSEALQVIAQANNSLPNGNPDAWGRVSVPGFNLQEPYPGSTVPWSLELNITRNATTSTYGPKWENNVTYITARMVPPPPGSPGAVLDTNGSWALNDTDAPDSWHVTMLSWYPSPFKNVPDKNDDESGSCPTSAVSAECVEAMRTKIIETPQVWAENNSFLSLFAPKPCGEANGQFWTPISWNFSMNQNFTKDSMLGLDFANEFDFYNMYGARTFIVVTIWAPSNTNNSAALSRDHVKFSCIKANNSRTPELMPTGAGAGLAAGAQLAWTVTALAGVVVLMVVA